MTFGLGGVVEAADGYAVVADAEREGRDEGEAFFPQFIHPDRGSEAGQVLILGAVFWVIGAIWDLAFACASGTIGTWLRRRPRLQAAQPSLEGVASLGLVGCAAITGSRSDH